MHFHVSLKDLEDIEGRVLSAGSDDEIVQRLRHVYEFLPAETIISVSDGMVSIDIPEHVIANKLEAIRLHEKASQRAKALKLHQIEPEFLQRMFATEGV